MKGIIPGCLSVETTCSRGRTCCIYKPFTSWVVAMSHNYAVRGTVESGGSYHPEEALESWSPTPLHGDLLPVYAPGSFAQGRGGPILVSARRVSASDMEICPPHDTDLQTAKLYRVEEKVSKNNLSL